MSFPIAFSFPAWICRGCKQRVEWIDAVIDEEDGKLYAIRHKGCSDG